MKEKDAILQTLDAYADAYCAKNVERLMSVFDHSEDISVIATGADELCAGRDQIEALFRCNFSEATATRFAWGWHHVIVVEGTAVVAMALVIHLKTDSEDVQVPVRWTVSMIKRDGRWAWLHRHASVPAASQEAGSAYPIFED